MDIILSNSSGKPIYEQIADQVKEQILAGALSAGDALPSMRVLAKELRISVITTKRAYEELERDGFLDNVPGKGCFVAPQNRELLREAQLRRVEDILAQAVDEARKGGFSLSELQELLTLLYQGDEL
ncbi:MAG: GntR family transcriptional regulator [Oscillospiraceae bacterium]|nr:GntR family transcriptional regulator [Oscillospiraceae bacterium]